MPLVPAFLHSLLRARGPTALVFMVSASCSNDGGSPQLSRVPAFRAGRGRQTPAGGVCPLLGSIARRRLRPQSWVTWPSAPPTGREARLRAGPRGKRDAAAARPAARRGGRARSERGPRLRRSLCGTVNRLPVPRTLLFTLATNWATTDGLRPTDPLPRSAVAPLVSKEPSDVCSGHQPPCCAAQCQDLGAKALTRSSLMSQTRPWFIDAQTSAPWSVSHLFNEVKSLR